MKTALTTLTALAALTTLCPTVAHAALTATYTDRASWEASFGRPADLFEDFNSYSAAPGTFYNLLPETFGPLTVTSEAPDDPRFGDNGRSWLTTWAGGDDYLIDQPGKGLIFNRLGGGVYDRSITYTWDRPVLAMGFDYNVDVAQAGRPIAYATDNGQSGSFTPITNGVEFRGFVFDTAFTSITLSSPIGDRFFGTDNIAAFDAAYVPEPESLALLGLGGLMLMRRRRSA